MGMFNRKKKDRTSNGPVGWSSSSQSPTEKHDKSSKKKKTRASAGSAGFSSPSPSPSEKNEKNTLSSSSGSLSMRNKGFSSFKARRSKTFTGLSLNSLLSPVSESGSPSAKANNYNTETNNQNHNHSDSSNLGSDAQNNSSPENEDSDSFSNLANSSHHCASTSLPILSPTMAAIHARTEEMFRSTHRSKPSSGDTSSDSKSGLKLSKSAPRPQTTLQTEPADSPLERRWTEGIMGLMTRKGTFSGGSVRSTSTANTADLTSHWLIDFNELSIGRTIGHSSFGNVCQGTLNGTNVAVKTIHCDSNDGLAAIQKEAELNCKLRHPNIVLFMGICVQPTKVCLVTELMSRGNVRELLLKDIPLDCSMRLRWALDTARGMAYLHSLNPPMIHCDLKTTNLLVDRGMNVKICDFGLSRFRSDSNMSAVGTVHFSAPEVLRSEYYTENADLFSFGTVLWELHSRKCVFEGLSKLDIYNAVMEGNMPEIEGECETRYQQIMHQCWSMDPKDRPSFREVIDRLSVIVKDEDTLEN